MAASIHITAHGCRTPLGSGSGPVSAAVRAGINAAADHPFFIDRSGQPLLGAFDPWLDPALEWPDRLVVLIQSALQEACGPLCVAGGSVARVPVYLCLPEIRPGFTKEIAAAVSNRVGQLSLGVELEKPNVFLQGHAGGLLAFASAVAQIQTGTCDSCLIVGADSYFHPATLGWLDEHRQLVGAASRSGFVPGEGAGACLLMSDRARVRLGMPSLARVVGAEFGRENELIKTDAVCLGKGLSATVRSAVEAAGPENRINEIYCDINGERYRSEEWGFVCLQEAVAFDDPTAYHSPAESWGDLGAASGPLLALLACQAGARQYAVGPRALLWASSESGPRCAVVLETGLLA